MFDRKRNKQGEAQMSMLFSGQGLKGRAVNVEIGADGQGRTRARWDMEIVEGEHKGKVAKYSGKLDPDNRKFTWRDMKAIGWRGEKHASLPEDAKKAGLVVEFNAEIAEHNGNSWVSARFSGATPLAPLDNDSQRELDRALSEEGGDPIPF